MNFNLQTLESNKVCFKIFFLNQHKSSLVAQMAKNPPAMQQTWVWSLGWEDPLEEGTATHFSILAWRISWTEEPGRLQSMESQRVGHNWVTHFQSRLQTSPCQLQHPLEGDSILISVKAFPFNKMAVELGKTK